MLKECVIVLLNFNGFVILSGRFVCRMLVRSVVLVFSKLNCIGFDKVIILC